jgi:hypothetical protein
MATPLSDMLDDLGLERGTVVVCPSISFPGVELRKITGILHYEERLLFSLLCLRDPRVRIVYLTALPIEREIVDYYLGFLDDPADARARLQLFSIGDASARSLSVKLLEAPDALARLRALVGDQDGFMLPFNVTPAEATLADELGVPLYAASPELVPLGSKSGARRLARAMSVEIPEGAEDLWSMDGVERAMNELRARRPGVSRFVIKLNNGFSGQGNAIVDVHEKALPMASMVFCSADESWPSFARKIAAEGAVVEELVGAPDLVSPSVQAWIHPGERVEVISTHDQVLGGPDDQVYLGCRFPASERYRAAIVERALRMGRALSARGVLGPFGVDFLVSRAVGVLLSEINLRMGGTTHPFGMVRLATCGHYDASTGELVTNGRAKAYVATDNLKSDAYVGLNPPSLIEAIRARGLGFDSASGSGVTLHLLGALERFGKFGATCVADSTEEADETYRRLVAVVDAVAETRRRGGGL